MDRPLVPAPLARGARGAVVAPHHLATAAGLDILRAGGSAVDAAIATNAVLSVVMPNGCGLGGDAFWLIWDESTRTETGLNGSGRSPVAADAAKLRAAGLRTMPDRGPLTITVPGAVRSWSDAHRRHGRLGLGEILAPAIELAHHGFPAWDGFVEACEKSAGVFTAEVGPDCHWFTVYRPLGRPWQPGERVRLPNLAATLERLAEAGLDDFYEGATAERQVRGLAAAGAPFTLDDLRTHTSTWTTPVSTDYRGAVVTTHPPNSSGLVALELLNVLEQFDPPPAEAFAGGLGADARWAHLGIEASKVAQADRDAFISDPDFVEIPVDRLRSKEHAAELAPRIDQRRASRPPAATLRTGGDTVFLAVVDAGGNAVSLIASNFEGFGSGIVDPETGIGYQNRGSYFSLDPAHRNVLAPRKRTLHTLLPGMILRDGRPWVIAGSMGGEAQPQIHAQVVSALVDGRLDVASAVAMPRWFVRSERRFAPPEVVAVEPRFREGIIEGLEGMRHRIERVGPFDPELGHCHAIELVRGGPAAAGGSLAAATDPRSAGLPAVY